MISFFRRIFQSKIGLGAMVLFLVVIAFAFVAGDLSNISVGGGTSGGGAGDRVMTVDGRAVSQAELRERVQREYGAVRGERQDLTLADYVAQGGVENVAERMVSSYALDAFARAQGMAVSRTAEIARIQSIPAFRGFDGQFDRGTFDAALQRIGLTEAQFREEIAREMLATQVLVPVTGAARAPAALVRAQADLLLETRAGASLFIPVASLTGGPAPTDGELADAYRRNIARYTVPERRVVRYALLDAASLPGTQPSAQDIEQAYRADPRSRGSETRTLTQVILPSEAAARALAERVRGGASFAAAAGAAQLEPATLGDQSREAYQRLSSEAVADAAFGAAEGTIAPIARSGLGYHVVRVDAVVRQAVQPLDAIRGELVQRLQADRANQALSDAVARMQDLIAEGATFAEAAQQLGVAVQTTPPLLADGRQLGATPEPAPLAVQLARAAFGSDPDDDPAIQEVVPQQSYALVDVERVVPAAAPPLAEIRARVSEDVVRERALAEARRLATGIATRAGGAATLAQAIAGAGRPLPSPTPVGGQRQAIAAPNAPPALAALFSLRPGEARAFEAPDASGWHVVHLDRIERGDAAARPDLVQGTAVALGGQLGNEYAQQFMSAVRAATGSSLDRGAVAATRQALGPQDDQ